MSIAAIQSPPLAYLPWIGSWFEESSAEEINKIRDKNFFNETASIKDTYTFMATHLHTGGIKQALSGIIDQLLEKEDLKSLIDPLVDLLIEHGDPYLKCLEVFPEEKIKIILNEEGSKIADFYENAKKLAEHLPVDFCVDTSLISFTSNTLFSFLGNILHLFQSTFRLDTEEQYMSIFDTNSLLDIYVKYLTIPVFIASKLGEWILNWQTAFLATVIIHVVLGIALIVYNKYFKKAPGSLPRGVNLNRALQDGRISPAGENPKLLKSLDEKLKLHPFLLGESGTGKTSLAVAYAQQQIRLQKEGKEFKTIYTVKTTDLVESFVGMGEQINQIAKMLEGRKDVVIFFEEFDSTLKKDKTLYKTLFSLRDKQDVICIPVMTPKGYEQLKEEKEFCNRFFPLEVGGKMTTEQAVRYFHRTQSGEVYVTEEVFQELAKCAHPSEAIAKLKRSCHLVANQEKLGEDANAIRQHQDELVILQEKLANEDSIENETSVDEKIEEIKKLEEKFNTHAENWKKVHHMSKRHFQMMSTVHKLARDLKNNVIAEGSARDSAVKKYTFLRFHLLPIIKQKRDESISKNKKKELPKDNYIPSYVDLALLNKC